ncbi:MAG: hypothetical protein ACRDO7_09350 [Nocardioidaceae bacterium]
MTRSGRRHVARPVSPLRAVVLWALPALALAGAVLIYAGAPVVATLAGCAGLFVVVLIVYLLDRSGLMRPPPVQRSHALSAPPAAPPPVQPAPAQPTLTWSTPPQNLPGPPPSVRSEPPVVRPGSAPAYPGPPPPAQHHSPPPAPMPARPDDAAADRWDR